MTFFLAILFGLTLCFFGWQFSRYTLRESRIEHLLALSGLLGISLYTFVINVLGHFLPIQLVFFAVILLFIVYSFFPLIFRRTNFFRQHKPLQWVIQKKGWQWALLIGCIFITISVTLISYRHQMDGAVYRGPNAVAMAEGNFPPKEIWNPEKPLRYHHAPDLFASAVLKVTNTPLNFAYALGRGILAGCLFLLLVVFAMEFLSASVFVAFISAICATYGGSIAIFSLAKALPSFVDIISGTYTGSYKFVSDAIVGEFTTPAINTVMGQHWGAMALVLITTVVYLYLSALQEKAQKYYWYLLVIGCLVALQALVSEPYFASLIAALVGFPIMVRVLYGSSDFAKRALISSLIVISIALPIAFVQGGLFGTAVTQQFNLTQENGTENTILFTGNDSDKNLFKLSTPSALSESYDNRIFKEMALLFVLFVPALFFLFRSHARVALFLSLLFLAFFLPPIVFVSDYFLITQLLWRFFFPINLIGGLVIGYVFAQAYLNTPILWKKISLFSILLIFLGQGFWTHVVWLGVGYPPGSVWDQNAVFFAKPGSAEAASYAWVRANTTIQDRFLILKDTYRQCGIDAAPNCLFVYNTGRFAPIFKHQAVVEGNEGDEIPTKELALFDNVSTTCDADILARLNFDYIYVDKLWPKGMEKQCLKNNTLSLEFTSTDDNNNIRIYKIVD